jgi:hypothetical protein
MFRARDVAEANPLAAVFQGEYAPIEVRGRAFGWLSLVFFVTSLFARFLVAALAPADLGFFRKAFLTSMSVPILAAIGLLCGLIGSRLGTQQGIARAGLWLNLVVLVLSGLAIAAFYSIMPDTWGPIPIRR